MENIPSKIRWLTASAMAALLATSGCTGKVDAGHNDAGTTGTNTGPGTGIAPGQGGTGSGTAGGAPPAPTGGTPGGGGSTNGTGGAMSGAGGAVGGTGGTTPGAGGSAPGVGGSPGLACAQPVLPRAFLRLPNRRYSNAVRDLLGLPVAPVLSGGGGTYDTLVPGDAADISTPLGFELGQVAAKAAADAPLDKLAPCTAGAAVAAERTCAGTFIDGFAPRAFRRPLATGERERLLAVYDAGRTDTDYATGVRLVIEAVLQSPSFMYEKALGTPGPAGIYTLTPHEVASELALLLFDSIPDATLWGAATAGRLGTPQGIATEVDRLLADPKVRASLTGAMVKWFGGTKVVGLAKDSALFPSFTTALQTSMQRSKELFLQDLLWGPKPGKLSDLYTSPQMWVDPTLAAFAGVTYPGPSGFVPVTLPATSSAGILTQPGLLAELATVNDTSVVHRGLFVWSQVLCFGTTPPPAGALDLAAAQKDLVTERQRATFRLTTSPCSACHRLFDPLGLVFEGFDAIGHARATTAGGAAIDTSAEGVSPASLQGRLAGPGDLAARLAQSPEAASCAAKQVVAYALGRGVSLASEQCVAEDVRTRFTAAGAGLVELFRALANAPGFRTRGEGAM